MFHCKIGTADGRIVEKVYPSTTGMQLKTDLEKQGFHVFQIRRQYFSFLTTNRRQGNTVSGQRFLTFNQEFLVLLRSGLPIPQILDALVEQMESGSLREIITDIERLVRGGSSLSEALSNYPAFFPPLYIAAVKAGEKTGDLAQTLSRFLLYQKRVETIRGRVRNASFYPLLLTFAAVAVVFFLILFVVPRFTEIYADANAQLPMITRLLIEISVFSGRYWYLVVLAVLSAVVGLRTLAQSLRGRLLIDRLILRVPFWGGLKIDYALAGFNQTLATVLESGTPLVPAMKMSRGTLNNAHLESAMTQAVTQVEEGTALTDALRHTGFFPLLALRMVRVGESSGSLVDMLNNIADYYEAEVERKLTRLSTMIEPVLMMTMGLLIAFIIVAMYVPIFELAGTVG